MNSVQTLLHLPWLSRLGWTLLNFLWQGSLIAGLLAVLRGLWGNRTSASARYTAACGALAVMVVAPLVTFLVLTSSQSAPGVARTFGLQEIRIPPGAALSLSYPNAWERISPWLGAGWVAGVVFCLLCLSGGWLVTARLRSSQARPASVEWQSTLARLMTRLGVERTVRLTVSPRVATPAVVGCLRPVILVPVGALAGLPADHVEALLAHELAHIRRHDYLVNLLQSLAEALLFYHPAVWWVSRLIRAEREYCCDDLAVAASGGNVLKYAQALAELESCRPAHSAAMAAAGGSLRNRIRRLIDPSPRNSHHLPSGAAASALSAMLLLSTAVLAVRASASPAPPQEPVIYKQSIWPDTVKFGNFERLVPGLGMLTSATTAEVNLPQQQSTEVSGGQAVKIAFQQRHDIVAGRVQAVRPGVTNGLVTADLTVLTPLPAGVNSGEPIDVTIAVGEVANVVYVGRPVFANSNSDGTLFRLDPDGQHAVRVKVQFGRTSVNLIEVRSGLEPGDRVILSDTRAYDKFDIITLK
jgi:beta-lactamase regulating signal transducer with metallopeptidase domain